MAQAKINLEEYERLKKQEEKQKARYRKQNEHTKTLYDRLSFTVSKGDAEKVKKAAQLAGKTVNAYLGGLVYEDLTRRGLLER